MASFVRSLRTHSRALLIVGLMLFVLTACGGGSNQNTPMTLTVGGKMDTEAQLLTKMYVLVLKHAGFKVVERAALGTDDVVFNAMKSGQIDLYPEFTATGLAQLDLNSTGNAQQDYLQVKQGYEARYHITWLDTSPLNNTYGICTTQARASSLKLTKISDLAGKAAHLTVATPPDGIKSGLNVVKSSYGLTFKKTTTYNEESQTFPAVTSGAQDLNICYTTSAAIARYNFVLLQDDKNAFPVYNPAPLVRDTILKKAPQLVVALNKLAPFLTTTVSQQLQAQVIDGKSVASVATQFLQSKGLI